MVFYIMISPLNKEDNVQSFCEPITVCYLLFAGPFWGDPTFCIF